jgi:hypothetical protein
MYPVYVDMLDHIRASSFVLENDEPEIPPNPPPVIPTVLLAGWPGSDPPVQDLPIVVEKIEILSPPTTYAPHAPQFSRIHEDYLASKRGRRECQRKFKRRSRKGPPK